MISTLTAPRSDYKDRLSQVDNKLFFIVFVAILYKKCVSLTRFTKKYLNTHDIVLGVFFLPHQVNFQTEHYTVFWMTNSAFNMFNSTRFIEILKCTWQHVASSYPRLHKHCSTGPVHQKIDYQLHVPVINQ